MFARQYRETSRAQASCPCFCCAEAADVIKARGMTKRILFIGYAFALGSRNQDASIALSSEVGGGRNGGERSSKDQRQTDFPTGGGEQCRHCRLPLARDSGPVVDGRSMRLQPRADCD